MAEPAPDRNRTKPLFTLQWDLAARTGGGPSRCRTCAREKTGAARQPQELSPQECLAIVDDFAGLCGVLGRQGRIDLTGGDPLTRPGVAGLIGQARARNIVVSLHGDPRRLTPVRARKLKQRGVTGYQVNLEGMQATHDRIRGPGSFRTILRAIRVLRAAGIPCALMFNLTQQNAGELVPAIRLAAAEKVRFFDFMRVVPRGRLRATREQVLRPGEYRALLLDVFEEYNRLREEECSTRFGRKDPLWQLLYQEIGLLHPYAKDHGPQLGGCGIGSRMLALLADGTVCACRRLPIKIGVVPRQTMKEVFAGSLRLRTTRLAVSVHPCGACELKGLCGGCMAVAYGGYGDHLAPDPQCWKSRGTR